MPNKITITRNYTAKVKKCPEWDYLRLTHEVYNRELAFMCGKLFDMKNGRHGDDYRQLFKFIINGPAQYAHGILRPVTSKEKWRSKLPGNPDGKDYEWAVIAARLNSDGPLLFDRHEKFRGMSGEMSVKIFQFATAKIKSYTELLSKWQTEKETWEKNRLKWLTENEEYTAVKERFDTFEKDHGKIRGKKRWKLYNEFIKENPDLEKFQKTHLYWNKEYKRFKRRPTYTAPGSKHPEWFQFKKNETYKELDINKQTLKLQVITEDRESGIKFAWYQYEFLPDTRLKALGAQANIKGVKMVFRDGKPYLNFAVEIECNPRSEQIPSQKHVDKYSVGWFRKKLAETVPNENLITMAVDLGIRNIAVATVMKGDHHAATQFIKLKYEDADQPVTLPHIAAHIRDRSQQMSDMGGRIRRGQTFSKELQTHITAMKLDRAKKSANRLVAFAVQHNVHVIVFEKLQGLIPSDQIEKRINKKLMEWNRRKIVEWTKNIAEPYGILVCEVFPRMTSQICNKCGMIGIRYNVRDGKDIVEKGGRLFRCRECGYRTNADFNASINLHRVFKATFVAPKKLRGKNVYEYPDGRRVDLDNLDDKELGISGDNVFSV